MARLALALCAVLLAACSEAEPTGPAFNTQNGVHEIMEHVLDPAADAVWGGSGYVITAAGEQDLSPTTPEGWQAVENGAAVVAEAGNLLMLPGRGPDEPQWAAYSRKLSEAGLAAMKAAQAKDKQAVFDTGGKIYEVCVACHQRYMPKPE
ncbi:hypothetical protein [Phenylobacterium sp.]|uniref:hypothetical protein n=1 Tax=Phenylobacterium sp. TaxID=1871053 RepID=UPI00273332A4|nr:hypothetical protein [Phenylobacterium sp.]MDP3854758.1 hypothetical protein [Phenylobacterium sp.]